MLPWKVWHQVLSFISDVRELCRLERVSRSFQADIRHFRWSQVRSVHIRIGIAQTVQVVVDGKELPKSFPLETGKLVVECLMERAWKVRELRLHGPPFAHVNAMTMEREFLRLLTIYNSQSIRELTLETTECFPEFWDVISTFSGSLTSLSV